MSKSQRKVVRSSLWGGVVLSAIGFKGVEPRPERNPEPPLLELIGVAVASGEEWYFA